MKHEILTPEEFAERLKIGRSTLFDWLQKGILVPGKHFLKVGRILRFIWSDDVVITLLELSSQAAQRRQAGGRKNNPVAARNPIDWDY